MNRCRVCRLPPPVLADVDQALLRGEPVRSLASRIVTPAGPRPGHMSYFRHLNECVPLTLRRAKEADDLAHAVDVVAQLKAMNGAALQVLQQARQAGDGDLALKAIATVVKQLELVAKASGDIDERPTVNVLVLPEFVAVQTAIVEALGPYPEAREAVVGRLAVLEGGRA